MPRVVLVTGCSHGGIGYALCEQFVVEGCQVYATARRLESMTDLAGPQVVLKTLDITNTADVHRVVEEIVSEAGRIDIVVNNAGKIGIGPLIEQTVENVQAVLDANTTGAFRVAQAAFPHMAKRKSGVIVNIGSVVGDTPVPWNGLYSASKAAQHMMSRILTMELSPFNIHVLNVMPGAVRSNIAANGSAEFSLSPNSLYGAYLPDILRRLHASQASASMPTVVFAQRVVKAALKKNPPTELILGGNALVFKLMRWMPFTFVRWFFWRMFSKKK
ncbi:Short-chain dehydrogenase reductase family protein [Mycena kentingensis (nom. inval.)]|nr:Short-chain dehydrogenase reductase family protein [Mycena kentingensis (nom. inval.)]